MLLTVVYRFCVILINFHLHNEYEILIIFIEMLLRNLILLSIAVVTATSITIREDRSTSFQNNKSVSLLKWKSFFFIIIFSCIYNSFTLFINFYIMIIEYNIRIIFIYLEMYLIKMTELRKLKEREYMLVVASKAQIRQLMGK